MTVDVRIPHAGQGHHTLLVALEVDDRHLLGDDLDALLDAIMGRIRDLTAGAITRHRNAANLDEHLAAVPYTLAQLRTPDRTWQLVRARQDVALALREAGWSYPKIGRLLHRDHSTVMHAVDQARRRRDMADAARTVQQTRLAWQERVPA